MGFAGLCWAGGPVAEIFLKGFKPTAPRWALSIDKERPQRQAIDYNEATRLQDAMGQTEFNLPAPAEFKPDEEEDYMAGLSGVLAMFQNTPAISGSMPVPIADSQNKEKERGPESPAVDADYDKLERLVAAFT